ncbi:MAG: hypothetical protein ACJLTB_03500 [Algoriphagus aquaeductus]|uniref:hypothetical protein n=1 Tax=Algoriphagus TaxID=246875 RepID=UPI00258E7DDB|nr:hypothetical protein [Algoriphagus sp.]
MKKLFLLVGLLGTMGLSHVRAQASVDPPPCTPSCEKAKYYAMSESSSGEMCCSFY